MGRVDVTGEELRVRLGWIERKDEAVDLPLGSDGLEEGVSPSWKRRERILPERPSLEMLKIESAIEVAGLNS